MQQPVTVLAPIKLAAGKTEKDLLSASEKFQTDFVRQEEGVLRRELVRTGEGTYMDIVQFRSAEDAQIVMEKEQTSPVCHAFFAIMDMTGAENAEMPLYVSLETYSSLK